MLKLLLFTQYIIFSLALTAESSPENQLGQKGDLLLSDDFSVARDKKGTKLSKTFNARANQGLWEKKENTYQSTWEPGVGHTPVMSYQGDFKNVIIECTFKYGSLDPKVDWHTQCFRIALDNRKLYTGHVLSAWANPNNDFIETGFLLQHIHKTKDKKIVDDILLDKQPLNYEADKWITVLLEVVNDEVLFQMEGQNIAYAKLDKLDVPKNLISLTLGKTWHQLQSFKVWKATPNPHWESIKNDGLKNRLKFKSIPHNYKK